MISVKRILVIILFSGLIYGCHSSLENKIEGFYSIDILIYNDNIITDELSVNSISFDSNGKCNLPPTRAISTIRANREVGFWSITEKDSIVSIKTDHPIFNGDFKLSFKKDELNKLLKISLSSDTISFIASKALQNYELHKDDW